ncbi:MAG: hypothetical protein CMO98_01905 [Woeseia sp.]|nr:hypothetical protein [Woeseia sp.]
MSKLAKSYVTHARDPVERREVSWRTVLFGFIRSRRHAKRRGSEVEPILSDWHHPWIFFLAVSIMVMSSIDAFLTLELLQRGAYEANPVIAWVMEWGTASFAAIKMAVTGICILILVFLARVVVFKRIRTGVILTAFFSIYATLICYEFVILINRL